MAEKVIFYIAFGLFFLFLLYLMDSISEYFKTKKEMTKIIAFREGQKKVITTRTRIKNSFDILNIVNSLIDSEIVNLMKSYTVLNLRYDFKKLDGDVKRVSQNVYDAINKESFLDDLVITEVYLLKYIADESIVRMLKYCLAYNSTIPDAPQK